MCRPERLFRRLRRKWCNHNHPSLLQNNRPRLFFPASLRQKLMQQRQHQSQCRFLHQRQQRRTVMQACLFLTNRKHRRRPALDSNPGLRYSRFPHNRNRSLAANSRQSRPKRSPP